MKIVGAILCVFFSMVPVIAEGEESIIPNLGDTREWQLVVSGSRVIVARGRCDNGVKFEQYIGLRNVFIQRTKKGRRYAVETRFLITRERFSFYRKWQDEVDRSNRYAIFTPAGFVTGARGATIDIGWDKESYTEDGEARCRMTKIYVQLYYPRATSAENPKVQIKMEYINEGIFPPSQDQPKQRRAIRLKNKERIPR